MNPLLHISCQPNATQSVMRRSTGFTLIELLVVIAIIAALAGLMIGAYPAIKEKGVRSRVQAELNSLVVAVESYHKDQGFYPPDNPNNTAQPPLFYELLGCKLDGNQFIPANQVAPVAAAAVQGAFGVDGFVNVSAGGKSSRNYLPDLKAKQYSTETGPGVALLTVPYQGPAGDLNPWNYNSSKPVRNPESFDLWADVRIGGKTITIGNWRQ
jgi:prepilin-type N-terminal cleavage/methylation domain-containing protein